MNANDLNKLIAKMYFYEKIKNAVIRKQYRHVKPGTIIFSIDSLPIGIWDGKRIKIAAFATNCYPGWIQRHD